MKMNTLWFITEFVILLVTAVQLYAAFFELMLIMIMSINFVE